MVALSEFIRPECRETGAESLDVFLGHYIGELAANDYQKTGVLFIEGLPASGKTTITDLTLDYLSQYTPCNVIHIHWDAIENDVRRPEYADELAKALELFPYSSSYDDQIKLMHEYRALPAELKPKANEPDIPQFLRIVNNLLELRVADELRYADLDNHQHPTILVVEKPNGAAIKEAGEWISRKEYGSDDCERLSNCMPPYTFIPRDSFYVGAIECVASSWVRKGLALYRDLINNAHTLQDANAIQGIFSYDPFVNDSEWQHAKGGGSLKMVQAAEQKQQELVYDLAEQGLLDIEPILQDVINHRRFYCNFLRFRETNPRDELPKEWIEEYLVLSRIIDEAGDIFPHLWWRSFHTTTIVDDDHLLAFIDEVGRVAGGSCIHANSIGEQEGLLCHRESKSAVMLQPDACIFIVDDPDVPKINSSDQSLLFDMREKLLI
jgi:hypothetical protein